MLVAWGVVYVAKLPVTLFFAWGLTEAAGRGGMAAALLLLFGLGAWVVARFPSVGEAVLVGGALVGVGQVVPFLQVTAGAIGVSFARDLGQTIGRDRIGSEGGGFAATMVTGGLLIALALALGGVVRGASAWVLGLRAEWQAARKPGGVDVP